jgi:TPR repeat protein
MIENALFGFRGRLGRLAFLGWNLAALLLVGVIIVGFLILGAGLSYVLSPSSGGPAVLGVMMAVTAGGAGVWSALALTVKRVRDTGLAPLPVMIGAAVLFTFDYYILTRFTGVRFVSPFASHTPLGGLLAIGWFVFLICWPGAASGPAFDTHAVARNSGASDKIVRGTAIAIMLFATIVSVGLLTPLKYLVGERHALAQRALASGWPSASAALLSALAELPDSRALNNLGVLRARGVGTEQNFGDARRLLALAADHGSVRARLNSVLIAKGGCSQDLFHATDVAESLAPIAALDWAAASHIQDCLYFEATARILPDRDRRSVAAGTQVQQSRDGNVLLHSGSALLNRARTMQGPTSGDTEEERQHDLVVLPVARKAMELLFAAAETGEAGAYEPLGILAMQFGERLGDDPLAVRLRERSNWEWLEVGAEKGDWAAQCRVADSRMSRLRWDGKPYTREAFDAAVAMARGCIDRREAKQETQWSRPPEWLAVTPRLPYQARPLVEIASTEAALNGLLFFDADRKLNASGTNGAPGRK